MTGVNTSREADDVAVDTVDGPVADTMQAALNATGLTGSSGFSAAAAPLVAGLGGTSPVLSTSGNAEGSVRASQLTNGVATLSGATAEQTSLATWASDGLSAVNSVASTASALVAGDAAAAIDGLATLSEQAKREAFLVAYGADSRLWTHEQRLEFYRSEGRDYEAEAARWAKEGIDIDDIRILASGPGRDEVSEAVIADIDAWFEAARTGDWDAYTNHMSFGRAAGSNNPTSFDKLSPTPSFSFRADPPVDDELPATDDSVTTDDSMYTLTDAHFGESGTGVVRLGGDIDTDSRSSSGNEENSDTVGAGTKDTQPSVASTPAFATYNEAHAYYMAHPELQAVDANGVRTYAWNGKTFLAQNADQLVNGPTIEAVANYLHIDPKNVTMDHVNQYLNDTSLDYGNEGRRGHASHDDSGVKVDSSPGGTWAEDIPTTQVSDGKGGYIEVAQSGIGAALLGKAPVKAALSRVVSAGSINAAEQALLGATRDIASRGAWSLMGEVYLAAQELTLQGKISLNALADFRKTMATHPNTSNMVSRGVANPQLLALVASGAVGFVAGTVLYKNSEAVQDGAAYVMDVLFGNRDGEIQHMLDGGSAGTKSSSGGGG